MKADFHSLSASRKYWIRLGHKHVPHPDCCCGYTHRFSRSIRNGSQVYRCPIHVGFYYLCYRYLLVIALFLSYVVSGVFKLSPKYLLGTAIFFNARVRKLEHDYGEAPTRKKD